MIFLTSLFLNNSYLISIKKWNPEYQAYYYIRKNWKTNLNDENNTFLFKFPFLNYWLINKWIISSIYNSNFM